MEAPKLNNLKEFLEWFYGEFKVPESSQFELSKKYAAILPKENCDFGHLRNCILNEWRSKNTLPTAKWLNYRIRPIPQTIKNKTLEETNEYLRKFRKHQEEAEKHRSELKEMMRRDINEFRKKWGRPIKEFN